MRDERAAQVAFETNSSIGSENCSIDSIQMEGLPSSQAMQPAQQQSKSSSIWCFFFKPKQNNQQQSAGNDANFVQAPYNDDMHTI